MHVYLTYAQTSLKVNGSVAQLKLTLMSVNSCFPLSILDGVKHFLVVSYPRLMFCFKNNKIFQMVLSVPSSGSCQAYGDPHFKTFDGHYYDFMGLCTYTLVADCPDGVYPDIPRFEVLITNRAVGNGASAVDIVTVHINNNVRLVLVKFPTLC